MIDINKPLLCLEHPEFRRKDKHADGKMQDHV